MTAVRRSQQEIVERIREVGRADFFGSQTADLTAALDFEHAKEFLKEGVTAEEWSGYPKSAEEIRMIAKEYFEFALGKAIDHRGLSASRSIDHYRAWLWLLEPELFEGFEAVPYEQYGVPKLRAAATILDIPNWDQAVAAQLMKDDRTLLNMAEGRPCRPGCDEGCGA